MRPNWNWIDCPCAVLLGRLHNHTTARQSLWLIANYLLAGFKYTIKKST